MQSAQRQLRIRRYSDVNGYTRLHTGGRHKGNRRKFEREGTGLQMLVVIRIEIWIGDITQYGLIK